MVRNMDDLKALEGLLPTWVKVSHSFIGTEPFLKSSKVYILWSLPET